MITLKELRARHNMKQIELAEIVGVNNNTISSWERNVYNMNVSNLKTICLHFNVSADELLDIKLK